MVWSLSGNTRPDQRQEGENHLFNNFPLSWRPVGLGEVWEEGHGGTWACLLDQPLPGHVNSGQASDRWGPWFPQLKNAVSNILWASQSHHKNQDWACMSHASQSVKCHIKRTDYRIFPRARHREVAWTGELLRMKKSAPEHQDRWQRSRHSPPMRP